MLRRLSIDIGNRPLRKRSISDSNLNRLVPLFTQNISTNIQDVLDYRSKCEYEYSKDMEENNDEESKGGQRMPGDGAIDTQDCPMEGRDCSPKSNSRSERKRRTGFVSIGAQVYNSLSKLVAGRSSVKRRATQPNDPRQLIFAIRNQDINRVRYILETYPVDVNGNDSKGVTAVHEAALDGQWDVIALLLQYNAEINKKDNEGLTSLDYAVFGGHFECAQYLIGNGATVESVQDGMAMHFK